MTETPSFPPPTAPPPPPPGPPTPGPPTFGPPPFGPPPSGPPPSDPPPSDPPLTGAGRLVRDRDDAVVAGVCAAVGRYTGTDPVLWRVTVAVLALFGGAGVVLYVLGWLLVPRSDEDRSVLERLLRRPDGRVGAAGIVLAVVAGVVLIGVLDDGPGLGALLVLGVLAYLVVRERRDPGSAAAGPSPAAWPAEPAAWAPVRRPRPPRRPSRLGPLTLSAAALLTGLLLTLRLSGVDGVTAPRVVAAALLVVGAGLVVGTWVGRARWLLAVGAVLALLLGATAAAQRVEVADGLGERTWTPTGEQSYRLGAGEGLLDLRELPAGRTVDVDARVGLGALTVLVPEGTTVRVDAEVGVGEVVEVDRDGDRTEHGGGDDTELHEVFVVGDPADRVGARLDLEVGMGQLEVRRVAP